MFGRTFLDFAKNKKTYFMAGGVVVLGALQAFNIHVPDFLIAIFGGGAILTHRAALAQVANDVIDTKNTLATVVALVSTPTNPKTI